MSRGQLRAVLPSIYVIAILIAVFFGNGKSVGAVAAIGAIALGAAYRLLEPGPGGGRNRQRNRNRGGGPERPVGPDGIQDS